MRLPFDPPIEPMLSTAADALPAGEGWLFEPKWDGFRTLAFGDGGRPSDGRQIVEYDRPGGRGERRVVQDSESGNLALDVASGDLTP